jgi:hypothetical protein
LYARVDDITATRRRLGTEGRLAAIPASERRGRWIGEARHIPHCRGAGRTIATLHPHRFATLDIGSPASGLVSTRRCRRAGP